MRNTWRVRVSLIAHRHNVVNARTRRKHGWPRMCGAPKDVDPFMALFSSRPSSFGEPLIFSVTPAQAGVHPVVSDGFSSAPPVNSPSRSDGTCRRIPSPHRRCPRPLGSSSRPRSTHRARARRSRVQRGLGIQILNDLRDQVDDRRPAFCAGCAGLLRAAGIGRGRVASERAL